MTNTEFATAVPYFMVGQMVQVNPRYSTKHAGVKFRVEAIPGGSRTKLKVVSYDGGIPLSGSPDLFILPNHEAWIGTREEPVAEIAAPIVLGSPVRIAGKPGVYIVIKVGVGTFNAAALGGDGNRFFRSLPSRLLTLISDFDFTDR